MVQLYFKYGAMGSSKSANDRYISLYRHHWMVGDLGPDFHRRRP